MITYVQGGFLSSPAQALVNPINTVGMMGRGLAHEFRLAFPDMFAQYQRYCRNKELAPGVLHVHRSTSRIVINLPTKQHWKPASKLENVEAGLRTFVEHADELRVHSVAFPQLGCGTGGLDWERKVRPVMERLLDPLRLAIHVHIQDDNGRDFAIALGETARWLATPPAMLTRERLRADILDVADVSPNCVDRAIYLLSSGDYLSRWSLAGEGVERAMVLLTSMGTLPYMKRIRLYERPDLTHRVGALYLDPHWAVEGGVHRSVSEDLLICPQVPLALPLAI